MKNIVRVSFALCVSFLVTCAPNLHAQESRGTISGAVLDPGGAAIPGATVTATEVRTGVATPTKSDRSGNFNLPFLPPGMYQVQVDAPGFRSFVRRGITLTSSEHSVVDVHLEVGQSTQTVTVNADEAMLDTANSSIGQSITTKQVEDFPLNGRNPMMVTQLAIGVIARDSHRWCIPLIMAQLRHGASAAHPRRPRKF